MDSWLRHWLINTSSMNALIGSYGTEAAAADAAAADAAAADADGDAAAAAAGVADTGNPWEVRRAKLFCRFLVSFLISIVPILKTLSCVCEYIHYALRWR